ncbi:hypothetical protein BC937DRAFT_91557 [Endogone sp. FLAS-F59071]|nr:hypothetical protein BC937DRAFT_91557 [Endogone sp. FLAS-F59071]|eukprot:RUS21741.1 hypothetical protein BC937DRAFT_91557 [Endogone sp. FLAS-F59071]
MVLIEHSPAVRLFFIQLQYTWTYGLLIIAPWNWITVFIPVMLWGPLRLEDVGLKSMRIASGILGTVLIIGLAQLFDLVVVFAAQKGKITINPSWLAAPWYGIILDYVNYYLSVGLFEEFFFRGFALSQLYLCFVNETHPPRRARRSSRRPAPPQSSLTPSFGYTVSPTQSRSRTLPTPVPQSQLHLRLIVAVLTNSVIFALFHLPADIFNYGIEDPIAFIDRVFFGIVVSVIYILTDNLFLTAGVHCVFDALDMSETHAFPALQVLGDWELFEVPAIGVVVALAWVGVVRGTTWYKKRSEKMKREREMTSVVDGEALEEKTEWREKKESETMKVEEV